MASLGTHCNVWETCLQLLERKGFRLRVQLGEDLSASAWFAERGEIDLQAEDPIALLGLAAIYEDIRPERHVPYWWLANTRRDEAVWDRLLDEEEEQERLLLDWRARPEWSKRIEDAWRDCEGNVRDAADLLGTTARVLAVILKDMKLLS